MTVYEELERCRRRITELEAQILCDCNRCDHMEPKEAPGVPKHFCTILHKRVFHANQHPKLPIPWYCPIKEAINASVVSDEC